MTNQRTKPGASGVKASKGSMFDPSWNDLVAAEIIRMGGGLVHSKPVMPTPAIGLERNPALLRKPPPKVYALEIQYPHRSALQVNIVDSFGLDVNLNEIGLPPNTRLAKPLFTVIQPENFHGSLDQEVYVISNNPSDASRWALWKCDNGCQVDDDVGRLLPICWCETNSALDEEYEPRVAYDLPDPYILSALLRGYFWHFEECDSGLDDLRFEHFRGDVDVQPLVVGAYQQVVTHLKSIE